MNKCLEPGAELVEGATDGSSLPHRPQASAEGCLKNFLLLIGDLFLIVPFLWLGDAETRMQWRSLLL